MNEVKKFIPMEGNGDVMNGGSKNGIENAGMAGNGGVGTEGSTFKVCGTSSNLPAKPSAWSKLKGILTYEIKVELTPKQQKIENEINEFLHKEITWQSFKDFLFQEVKITR